MTKAKVQSTLNKLYALYADSAAQKTEESNAAYAKIQSLCKKHSIDFDSFMKSKNKLSDSADKDSANNADNDTSAEKREKKVFVFNSRRNAILQLVAQAMYSKADIAEAIVFLSNEKYANVKQNKKAVSGTIYDINAHTDKFIKCCADSRLCFA